MKGKKIKILTILKVFVKCDLTNTKAKVIETCSSLMEHIKKQFSFETAWKNESLERCH